VLIRINSREAETPEGGIPLPLGALEALIKIDALLAEGNGGAAGLRAAT
jgi:hypothetical protein